MTTMAMDPDLREAFATLSAQGAETNGHARTAADRALEASLGVRRLEGRVEKLEKHVFGSDPPPAPGAAIVRQVSQHESELATLAGHVMAVSAKADASLAKSDKVIEMQEEQNKVLAKQNDVLAEQNRMLAVITKSVGGFLGHPLVRKVALAVGFAILAYFNRGAAAHLVGLE